MVVIENYSQNKVLKTRETNNNSTLEKNLKPDKKKNGLVFERLQPVVETLHS